MDIDQIDLVMLTHVVHIGPREAQRANEFASENSTDLCFCVHPEAWELISKCQGQPWWEADLSHLKILDGHLFVERHRQALEAWGLAHGMVERGEGYRVSWEDENAGFCSMIVDNEQQLQNESYKRNDTNFTGIPLLRPSLQLLETMASFSSLAEKEGEGVIQALAMAWAMDQGLHGVWWDDRLDPIQHSVPHGRVFSGHTHKVSLSRMRRAIAAKT